MSTTPKLGKLDPAITVEISSWLASAPVCHPLPKAYNDSTHAIWKLDTLQGSFCLKVCQADLLKQAFFWQATAHWFGLDLPKMLGDYAQVYRFLAHNSGLDVPELIACQSASLDKPGWLLNRWHSGLSIQNTTPTLICDLAQHLGKLHHQQQPNFGTLTARVMPLTEWACRIQMVVDFLQTSTGSALSLSTRDTLRRWQPKSCVPVMLDLRFDQFLQTPAGRLQALIDCDAFVWAPRALALVQLQVLLSDDDFAQFKQQYLTWIDWPEELNKNLQTALQELLYQMMVFGTV